METIYEETDLLIPAYALSAIVNGDTSGIEEEDEKAIDNYMGYYYDKAKEMGGTVIFSCGEEEPSFTSSPEFGLPCDCVPCTILIVK